MKRNILSIVILALLIMNLILTAIMMFTMVPSLRKANQLVTQVASVLDLELSEEDGSSEGGGNVSIDKVEVYDIADKLTINLKTGADGKSHYAQVAVSFTMNTEDPDYEKYAEDLSGKESIIKSEINTVISGYTIEEARGNAKEMQEKLLESIQGIFDSDFIIGVAFRDIVFQ